MKKDRVELLPQHENQTLIKGSILEDEFPQPGPEDTWRVVISYDLNGGKWPPEGVLSPRTITGVAGRSMPGGALDPERKIKPKHPYLKLARFKGWSVRFTDPANGSVIYDSGDEV